jgi:hypothetical protein
MAELTLFERCQWYMDNVTDFSVYGRPTRILLEMLDKWIEEYHYFECFDSEVLTEEDHNKYQIYLNFLQWAEDNDIHL